MIRVGFDVVQPIPEEHMPALIEKRARALELLARPYDKRPEGWDAPKEPTKRKKF
jgi:hypothetical protein